MALYLVQHGKCLPKEEDPERGLSEEGIREVNHIADLAESSGVRVFRIEHSGKTRALQTAEIFAAALQPTGGVHKTHGLNPLDDPVPLATRLTGREDLMLVGHLPFLSQLTSHLVTGALDRPVIQFQNGGIVCLDEERRGGGWVIKWTLLPQIG